MAEDLEPVTVYLPREIADWFKMQASADGRQTSALYRHVLTNFHRASTSPEAVTFSSGHSTFSIVAKTF